MSQLESEDSGVPECDPAVCQLPSCYCSTDGTIAPGVSEDGAGLSINEVSPSLAESGSRDLATLTADWSAGPPDDHDQLQRRGDRPEHGHVREDLQV